METIDARITQVATDDLGLDYNEIEIVETYETLADFEDSRKGWADSGSAKFLSDPISHAIYTGVRVAKGAQKKQFCVFDLGHIRAVVNF